MILLNGRHTKA